MALLALLVLTVASRTPLALEVVRDRQQLYREALDGRIENTFTLKLANKSQYEQQVVLAVEGLNNPVWHGPQRVTLVPGNVMEIPITLSLAAPVPSIPARTLVFVASTERYQVRTDSRFLAP